MRVQPDDASQPFSTRDAAWIGPDAPPAAPIVYAFVCRFTIETAATIRIHVSADERYELFLDGERVGNGPERGTLDAWRFESYAFRLTAGEHLLVARVQHLGDAAPLAQVSAGPAFLLQADPPFDRLLSTGTAPWLIAPLAGYRFERKKAGSHFICVGSSTVIEGEALAWNFARGDVPNLRAATLVDMPRTVDAWGVEKGSRRLVPATLPPMLEQRRSAGHVRYVAHTAGHPRAPLDQPDQHADWQRFIDGQSPVVIPANALRRVILDLGDYVCAYPELRVNGGRGAMVTIGFTESLYEPGDFVRKGDRNVVLGKDWHGLIDRFYPDGAAKRLFEPLWWQSGRYVAIAVETQDEPIALISFALRETRYPIEPVCDFDCDDSRLRDVVPTMLRSLQMCMHETYVDCPHYEQLMYAGDTRLQALTTYVTSLDDRLPRKAIELFDVSRAAAGLTPARTPSRDPQTIPPFSLWWVMMVRDYAWWRDDTAFVRARLPGVRAVLEAFLANVDDATDLPLPLPGWNFVDWVPGWEHGVPPGARDEPNATIALQLVLALRAAADLERAFGEQELRARFERRAVEIHAAVLERFGDARRALLAEDLSHTCFAEHANSLAELVKRSDRMPTLVADPAIARATIYFSHYLFEALASAGMADEIIERMNLWFDLRGQGFVTTPEMAEPTRSDCHGWGAHPLFHYAATICGIRPASPGFATVAIRPQLGSLQRASVSIPHPRGTIRAAFERDGDELSADIELPPGVDGQLVWNGHTRRLSPRTQSIRVARPADPFGARA